MVPGVLWMTAGGIPSEWKSIAQPEWKSITQLEDIAEFEGHVVAYETTCSWLTSDIYITLPGKPGVNFGYIQPGIKSYVNYEGETRRRYRMEPLLKWAWSSNADVQEIVSHLSIPLAIVAGEQDAGINNDYIEHGVTYSSLWNRKVYTIKGAGHSVFWENPQEFNQITSGFLKSIYS